MTCHRPSTVREALKGRLCAVDAGPYRIEYINDAGPYLGADSEHLALLERHGSVTDIVDVDGTFFGSLVSEYGAEGVAEEH